MYVPSLNEISKSVSELSYTQVKVQGSGVTDMKPVYSRLSSGDILSNFFSSFNNMLDIH